FADILLHTAAAMEGYPDVAQEVRDRYRCFVVDEYQDVTPLQQRVLDAWLGARDDLTVVGDANQTIYSFAGATAGFLLGFSRRFPDAVTVRLHRDYRSTPEVVSLANRVISGARGRPAGARLPLEGQQPPGPEPTFAEHDDEPTEAAAVASAIAQLLRDGVPAAQIAVLYRVNAQAELGATVRAVLARQGLTAEPPAGSAARSRWESLRALAELADDLATSLPLADLGRLVAELDTRADAAHPPAVQGVTLPIQYADGDQAALEEERRLLYVGVTRARRWLSLSWALSRSSGQRRPRQRSRFLRGLAPVDRPRSMARAAADPQRLARLRGKPV